MLRIPLRPRRRPAQRPELTDAIRELAPLYDRRAYREWIWDAGARSVETTCKHGNSHSPVPLENRIQGADLRFRRDVRRLGCTR